jgi:2-iminobutanoate/2-iminopropanoate deaminase
MFDRRLIFVGLAFVLLATVGVWFVADAAGKAKKRAIETADAPKAIGPYSQAVVANGMVFAAGQIGIDPKTGKTVEGGIEAETEQALKNLEAVLKASGSDFDNVVKSTIFLSDMNDFAKVNEVYGRFIKAPYPARATVQAARLPRDAKVEIEMTAIVKE